MEGRGIGQGTQGKQDEHHRDLEVLSVLKPFQCCFGCMLGVIVLLERKSSPQSQVIYTLEQVLLKDLPAFSSIIVPYILTSLPVPATEKHHHIMMLTPPCFTARMVLNG